LPLESREEATIEIAFGARRLSRFARGRATSVLAQSTLETTLRLGFDGREGTAMVASLDPDRLAQACASARRSAAAKPPRDRPLAALPPQTYGTAPPIDEGLFDRHDALSLEPIEAALDACGREGLEAAGRFATEESSLAVASTAGLDAFARRSRVEFALTASAGEGTTGLGQVIRRRAADLPWREAVERAVSKALRGRSAESIAPGPYDLVLEPPAVAALLRPLGVQAFGARQVASGRSAVAGRLGERVVAEAITLADDPFHPLAIGLPFDQDGVPKGRVVLLDRGIARTVLHDRRSARSVGAASTGHALRRPGDFGPTPLDLVLEPGTETLESLVAGVERGLLVTQFHYVNVLDPRTLLASGVTRNGTFRIERGRVGPPVRDLRFTESVLDAFSRVDGVERSLEAADTFFGGTFVVPALRVRRFHFTSGVGE
jgi:predicted Zn-dependent protease